MSRAHIPVQFWKAPRWLIAMRIYTTVVERCPGTGLYVEFVPGFPGVHTKAEILDKLNVNLKKEVIEMLLEDGEPQDLVKSLPN